MEIYLTQFVDKGCGLWPAFRGGPTVPGLNGVSRGALQKELQRAKDQVFCELFLDVDIFLVFDIMKGEGQT